MAVPSHIGSNTQDSASGLSLTFTVPAATTTGDFILVEVKQSANTTAQIWDNDGGGGNGYTRASYNRSTGGRDQETAIYWKFATSSSEPNPTFTWATGITPSQPMSGIMEVYRGVDTIIPFQGPSYSFQQNTPASTPPDVDIKFPNTRVVVFQASTHDDITAVAAPTGFTLRSQVWAGAANDHRNNFSADIEINTIGNYSPPAWQHTTANTTPESHAYTIALNEALPIHIIGGTLLDGFDWGDTNLTITGDGFEAVQGTGKVEIWSDTSGTIKVTQTIDTWSDTSIQIDTVQGSLTSNGIVYLVVTNDSADESGTNQIAVGLLPYTDVILNLKPDHFWKLNNTYNDTGITGPTRNMTSGIVGTQQFLTNKLTEDTSHCWELNSVTDRREIADSPNMNITISSKERTIMCWIQLKGIQKSMSSLWKEGGGVQNLTFLVGQGNVLMWQLADVATTRDNVQAYSNFRLEVDRTYFIVGRYSHLDTIKESRLYIDGIKQDVTDGNPMTLGIFDSHSGDVTWGDPDGNLEMGTVDIAFAGQEEAWMSHFATWSDNSTNTDAGGLSDTDIKILFERGAIPEVIITQDTEVNMQTNLDVEADTTYGNVPLAVRVERVTGGGGDLELTADNINFNSLGSLDLQWLGNSGETLTWVNSNGGSIDTNKISTPSGGTVIVVNDVSVKITVKDIETELNIENANIELKAASGGDLTSGDNILTGFTDSNGELEITNFRYTSNQPVIGKIRKATTGIKYKQANILSTIVSTGLDITILLIKDE